MTNAPDPRHVGNSIGRYSMAKYILLIYGLVFLSGCGHAASRQENRSAISARPLQLDTLTIEHDMAHQPFLLDTISPEAIKMLFGEGWIVKKQPIVNRFVKNQTDTLITIKKNKSYICLYAVSQEAKNFYQSAEI